jgi:hypothetical protein
MTIVQRTDAPTRSRRRSSGAGVWIATLFAAAIGVGYLWSPDSDDPANRVAQPSRGDIELPAAAAAATPARSGGKGRDEAARTNAATESSAEPVGFLARLRGYVGRSWQRARTAVRTKSSSFLGAFAVGAAATLLVGAALLVGLLLLRRKDQGKGEWTPGGEVSPPPPPPPPPPYDPEPWFVKEGMWKAVGASVAGTSHARRNQPCQDASYCRLLAGRILVGAVADGAGSARYGGEGAQVAARAAVDAVAAHAPRLDRLDSADHWHRVLRAAMDVARGQVEVSATLYGLPPKEFATTLLLFVGRPGSVIAAQIGDGAVIVQDATGGFHALTTPQNGEYANTTTFLVSPGAFKTVQHQAWDGPFTGIGALTDGLQRLALVMPTGQPHPNFFSPLFKFMAGADGADATDELIGFLRSDKVASRADDDLTLMLARFAS